MLIAFTPRIWPWLALLASVVMLGAAHAFERFGGLAPCLLCLRQREVYWVAMAVAAACLGLGRLGKLWPVLGGMVLSAVFLYGTWLAAFHAGVEWGWWPGPAACASSAGGVSASAVLEALGSAQAAPSCDTAPWRLAGLSMAGYNALISLVLALASAYGVFNRKARS